METKIELGFSRGQENRPLVTCVTVVVNFVLESLVLALVYISVFGIYIFF